MFKVEEGRKRRGRSCGDGGEGGDGDGDGDAESDASDASADDDRPRKRGRPPASHREKIKGFTDQEVNIFYIPFTSSFFSNCFARVALCVMCEVFLGK